MQRARDRLKHRLGLRVGSLAMALGLLGAGGCKGSDAPDAPAEGAGADEGGAAPSDDAGGDADGSNAAGGDEAQGADGADGADGGGQDGKVAKVAKVEPPKLPEPADAGSCPEDGRDDVGILASPRRAIAGEPLRLVAATLTDETPLALRVQTDDDTTIETEVTHRPGVPAAVIGRLTVPEGAKSVRVIVGRDGTGLACANVKVHDRAQKRPRNAKADGVWPVTRRWDAAEEALFSAWVREMFHAPRGESLAWSALHEVTADATRNLLHDHYAWSEDDPDTKQVGLFLRPDCADTPYFLRAYFAWKRELPFGFRQCSRGRGGKAPRCGNLHAVVGPPEHAPDSNKAGELGAVQRYFRRTLAWGVHTGNGRCAFGDSDTDFYPLALSRRGLRPGTIYADPYGHIFVMTELVDPEGEDPGVLYAIDGQPDGSITRKRFWEGNFLWNPDPTLGGSGFKAFRPLDLRKVDGSKVLAAADDEALARRDGYGDVSDEQSKLTPNAFYDRMDALITPGVRDPFRAQDEAIVALSEAAGVRVTSVNNGEAHLAKGGGTIKMPQGHAIFETTGAWENFSTPARDLRLLIAIDVATGYADKVARNPDAFGIEPDQVDAMRTKLAKARDERLADPQLAITYKRSDGSETSLTMAELVARKQALEMGYNPNDCPELRWGAAEGSAERSTCKRRAPAEQQRKMKAYRTWFTDRRRPARGDPGPSVD